jgi:hypothetical protein
VDQLACVSGYEGVPSASEKVRRNATDEYQAGVKC